MKKRSLLFVFLLSCISGVAQNNWIKRAAFGGNKLERAVAFSLGGKGYVSCGQDTANQVRNDLWEYNPGSNSWTQKASLPGPARRNAIGFSIGNTGYVGTGMDHTDSNMGSTLSDLWAYNPLTNTWVSRASYPGGWGNGVYFSTVFTINSRAYVCGGKVGSGVYLDQLWEYNPANNQWSSRADFPGGDRYQLASFAVNGKGYVGLGTDEDAYRKDIWEYNPSSNSWTQKSDFSGVERSSCSTFTLYDHGFVVLGGDGGYLGDLWEYNSVLDQWSLRAPFPGGERRNSISFSIGDKAYVGTGKGVSGLRRNFYEYNPIIPLGIEDLQAFDIKIYPNPCTEFIQIESKEQIKYIQIYDDRGSLVFETSDIDRKISTGDWARGVYLLQSFSSDNQMRGIEKIIKK